GPLVAGTYRPSNYEGDSDPFPPPAPAPPYLTTLSAFDGQPADGIWRLYVIDDNSSDSGQIAGGWCLTITGGPVSTNTPTAAATNTPTDTPTNTAQVPSQTPTNTPTNTAVIP